MQLNSFLIRLLLALDKQNFFSSLITNMEEIHLLPLKIVCMYEPIDRKRWSIKNFSPQANKI